MKIFRWHNGLKVIMLILFFVIGFFYAYYDLNLKRGQIREEQNKPIIDITKQIHLTVMDYYLGCHHNEERVLEIEEVDYQKILSELTCDWEVREIDDIPRIEIKKVLTKKLPGLCFSCKTQDYLGIYQDSVAVFYGTPERPGPVKEVTRIKIEGLPDDEIIDLNSGVTYKDEKEKLFILEGYSEVRDISN